MRTDKNKACYTVPELATKLGLSVETIYRSIRRKQIPHIKIGDRRLILPKTAIDKWLESASVEAR